MLGEQSVVGVCDDKAHALIEITRAGGDVRYPVLHGLRTGVFKGRMIRMIIGRRFGNQECGCIVHRIDVDRKGLQLAGVHAAIGDPAIVFDANAHGGDALSI